MKLSDLGIDPHAIALALMSAGLGVAVIALTRRTMRGRGLAARVLVALAAIYLFVWISPQFFHLADRLASGEVPSEIVIGWPPAPTWPLRLLAFSGPSTLPAHATGALGWALLILAFRPRAFTRVV